MTSKRSALRLAFLSHIFTPEHTMFTSSLGRAIQLALVVSTAASAQTSATSVQSQDDGSDVIHRSSASVSVIQSRPQGAFGEHVGLGYGLDGAYLLRLDAAGVLSLRANAGVVSYGDESRRTALSESVGGRVMVDVKTSNYIVPMSIGPQISWPTGLLRPYVNAGVGAQAFFTESRVQGTADLTALASTTNHSSLVASWSVGGGVYMPLHVGTLQVQLDLGMQYFGGGTASYLAAGSIVDLPGAQIAVTPLESATHMSIIRIGARVQP